MGYEGLLTTTIRVENMNSIEKFYLISGAVFYGIRGMC